SQAAEGRILAQSILHVASKPDMKALRRIDNLRFVVALSADRIQRLASHRPRRQCPCTQALERVLRREKQAGRETRRQASNMTQTSWRLIERRLAARARSLAYSVYS